MKYKLSQLCICVFVFASGLMFSQTKVIPYQQLPNYNGNSTGSNIYFSASMTTSSITITFEGPADRWIAFGLGSNMQPTDVFIYSIGHSMSVHPLGWLDYYNSSYNNSGVLVDGSQDWVVVSTNTLTSGQRTVTATRALSTGDANDAIINFTSTTLDLVWAKGSSANYTISYHGSTNRASGISLPWLSTPTASFTSSSTTICAGSSVSYSNLSTGGLTTYNWSFAGGSPASSTSTNVNVSYATPGTYSVVLTASNAIGTNTLTQVNYITVTPTIVPSVTISQVGGLNPICAGAQVNFTANPTNGGGAPSYQWKVNGINAGSNNFLFSTSALLNGDVVSCALTSNQACINPPTANSAGVTMTVNSTAPASVAIVLNSGSNPQCVGSLAVYSATPFHGGTNPSYQWKLNGTNVGTNSPTYSINTLSNGDVITCVLNSNDACASSTVATSSGITMTVSTLLVPSVSVSANPPGSTLCSGSILSFTAQSSNGGISPAYQWQVNGVNSGSNLSLFTSSTLVTNDVISCIMTSGLSCASPVTVTSSALTLSILPTPASPTITAMGATTFCEGESVTLSSSSSSGNIWSNGPLTQTVLATLSGNYSAVEMSNGCASPPSNSISVFVNSIPSLTLDPIGPFCEDSPSITLLGLPAGGNYSGNGVVGNVFNPNLATINDHNLIAYTYSQTLNNVACERTTTIQILVSDCIGVHEIEKVSPNVFIYPNPSSGEFLLQATNGKIYQIRIIDLNGKIIWRRVLDEQMFTSVDIREFSDGIYILELQFKDQILHKRIYKFD